MFPSCSDQIGVSGGSRKRFGAKKRDSTTNEEKDVIRIDAPDLLLSSSVERDESSVLFVRRLVEDVPSGDPVGIEPKFSMERVIDASDSTDQGFPLYLLTISFQRLMVRVWNSLNSQKSARWIPESECPVKEEKWGQIDVSRKKKSDAETYSRCFDLCAKEDDGLALYLALEVKGKVLSPPGAVCMSGITKIPSAAQRFTTLSSH